MKKAIQIQNDQDLPKLLETASRAGFQYISLGFGDSKAFFKGEWENAVVHIAELLKKYDLKCIQTHLPYYELPLSSEISDPEMENAIRHCITASAMLGAEWCVHHPRSSTNFNYDKARAFDDNRRSITKYLQWAIDSGIGLAVENMPLFKGWPEWKGYCSDYHDLIKLVDSFADSHLQICWDFGHAHLSDFDHATALDEIGSRIQCTHIHNNHGYDDEHLVPYIGKIDWAAILPHLKKIGYDGPLTLEIVYECNPVLDSYIRHSYACVEYLEELSQRSI